MVYKPENYEKYKRNFRFPAMGNLLQRKLKWDSHQEVSQQLSKDFQFAKDFIEISELSSKKNSEFHQFFFDLTIRSEDLTRVGSTLLDYCSTLDQRDKWIVRESCKFSQTCNVLVWPIQSCPNKIIKLFSKYLKWSGIRSFGS